MRTIGVAALSAALAAAPMAAVAQEQPRRAEPVVVTATKIEEPQERLGGAVTVITEEQLRTFNHPTIADALRDVPGVAIERSGGLGKTTSIRIRGAAPQQVQVLVDGVRMKSPTTGSTELADISLDQIERIEIVRGPQSTLYGSDAIGGVVNVITKRGAGPFSAYASTEAGTHDTLRERAGFSGSYTLFDYAFGGSWFESNGQFKNDGFEQRALAGRVGLALPAGGHLGLSGRTNRTYSELPIDGVTPTSASPFFVLDPDAYQISDTSSLSLNWDQKPVKWFESHARFGAFWNVLHFVDKATLGDVINGASDTSDTASHIEVNRREAELVMAAHAGQWNTLTGGVEHRNEFGRNRHTFAREIETFSYFFQDEVRLADRVILSAGRRHDDNSAFGAATTWRAGAVGLIKETGTKLRGTWGEGFRAPTLNDLFFPGANNPSLKPEHSDSWDVGVDQKLWANRLRLGTTYFENKFTQLIQFDLVQFVPSNIARARTAGLETTAEVDLLDNLFASVNYTYTETEDLDTHLPLRRFAPHRYNAAITWEPIRRLGLFVEAHVVSSQFEKEGLRRNRGYHVLNAGGVYHITEKRGAIPALDFTVRVNNLTDETYMEVLGFRALGINALAGLQARY